MGIFQLFHTSGSKECCLSPLVSDISWVMEQERIEKAAQGACLSDFLLAVSEPIAGSERGSSVCCSSQCCSPALALHLCNQNKPVMHQKAKLVFLI